MELEGDQFPLKEVADISRKDPKRIILDCASFPQVRKEKFAMTLLWALWGSGRMNKNLIRFV